VGGKTIGTACVRKISSEPYCYERLPYQNLKSHRSFAKEGRRRHLFSQLFQKETFPFYQFRQLMYFDTMVTPGFLDLEFGYCWQLCSQARCAMAKLPRKDVLY